MFRDLKKSVVALLFCCSVWLVISTHLYLSNNTHDIFELVRASYIDKFYTKAPFLHTHVSNEEHDPNLIHHHKPDPVVKPASLKEPEKEKVQDSWVINVDRISEYNHEESCVIFPYHFNDLKEKQTLAEYYQENFNTAIEASHFDKNTKFRIIQLNSLTDEPKQDYVDSSKYQKDEFKIFQLSPLIYNDQQCESHLQQKLQVEISQSKSLTFDDWLPIINRFKEENPHYYEELEPFWKDDIEEQIKSGVLNKHWHRLAGSSVWLTEYGVHFMISRVLYTPSGIRDKPIISLTYAQVFNDKWEEMKNVELISPSNNPDVGNELVKEEKIYSSMIYPTFLPIPSYHDYNITTPNKYYGPEDPRLLLIKNPKGYEEPLIIFNAYQRKIVESVNIDHDKHMNITFDYYRSIFMCWPWQFQRGKEIVDDLNINQNYKYQIYNRIAELVRDNIPKVKNQKNWTPMISYEDRKVSNYDESIYFIYRWSNLEVFKCQLSNIINGLSICKYDYRLEPNNNENDGVGPLRGGTQMVNINQLLYEYSNKITELSTFISKLPTGRELWLGFARAHLKNCGCGKSIYRPNLVLITKDSNPKGEKYYKISHISSFLGLSNVPILPWDPANPKMICGEQYPNALIPNGISDWNLKEVAINDDIKGIQDYLTLSFSVSDSTVDIIHIKGLLNEIFRLDYNTDIKTNRLIGDIDIIKDDVSHNWMKNNGFNNINVDCAIRESKNFCYHYGLQNGEKTKEEKEKEKAKQKEEKEKQEKEKQEKEKQNQEQKPDPNAKVEAKVEEDASESKY